MQGPSEKNIVPIFKKKRPRQPLYAFPKTGTQSTDGVQSSSAQFRQQQSFSGSNQQMGNRRRDGRQGSNTSYQTSDEGKAGVNRTIEQRTNCTTQPRTTSMSDAPYQPTNQLIPNQGHPQAGNMKRPLKPSNWQPQYDEPSPVKASRPSTSTAPYSSNYQYAHRNNIQEPQGLQYPSMHQPSMHQQNMHQNTMNQPPMHQPNMYQPPMNQSPMYQENMHQPNMYPPTMHQQYMHPEPMHQQPLHHQPMHQAAVGPVRQRPNYPPTLSSHPPRGSMGNAPSPFRLPFTPQVPPRHAQPGTTAAWEMKNPESAGSTVDKSMKILTVSIEELRYWTVSRDIQGLLFFELFGVLNSAVCSDETGVAKKFTLKDGNHTLQCIFYEMDRELGPLTRGQCLRCVGNILPKEGVFRCVSVRPATLAEQEVMRSMVAACDRNVREKLTASRIEP